MLLQVVESGVTQMAPRECESPGPGHPEVVRMPAADYPDVPPHFGHWLAGFIDGEGCFGIRKSGDYPVDARLDSSSCGNRSAAGRVSPVAPPG